MNSDTKIVKVEPLETEQLPEEDLSPKIGQWYWVGPKNEVEDDDEVLDDDEYEGDGVDDKNKDAWFGCVVHLGSNFANMKSRWGSTERIHFNEFTKRCKLEPNPDAYIDGKIVETQDKVNQLMGRVKEVTARLGVAPNHNPELASGNETQALAVINSSMAFDNYSTDLVKAKEETLPDLFKEIEKTNENLVAWMTAKVVPLKAQAGGMKGVIATIDDRIFSISLYAGLTETAAKIQDGEPAPRDTKVHLLQRMHYMDEECLARYEAGGMEFADLHAFDTWLLRPDNLERLLPFPRCIIAFRVRRDKKEREVNLSNFFAIDGLVEADKSTFLYIRNGEQVFWMETKLEFGEKLFPDLKKSQLDGGKLWADTGWGHQVRTIITDNEYQGMKEDHAREVKEYKVRKKAYAAALKTSEAKAQAKAQGKKKPDASCVDVPWPGYVSREDPTRNFTAFTPESVQFDDISKKIQDDIKKHNRIALIIQGLLDRSPVLHPHPPWEIWTSEGFEAALELVYDSTRALVAGEKPDFEAYRAKLNAGITKGSLTVGQDDAWALFEGEKENRHLDNNWRTRGHGFQSDRHRPYGNPGPGMIARVEAYSKKNKTCTFAWGRERQGYGPKAGEELRTTFSTDVANVFNVSAYKPGDFRQFFDDPRTRAEYLQWAPLLLEAEEYHAGNREVTDAPAVTKKKASSWEGRRRYRHLKYRKEVMGSAVRLVRDVTMQSGTVYKKGTLWRITDGKGDTFSITRLSEKGDGKKHEDAGRYSYDASHLDFRTQINGVDKSDFEVYPSIPRTDQYD